MKLLENDLSLFGNFHDSGLVKAQLLHESTLHFTFDNIYYIGDDGSETYYPDRMVYIVLFDVKIYGGAILEDFENSNVSIFTEDSGRYTLRTERGDLDFSASKMMLYIQPDSCGTGPEDLFDL